MMEGFKLQWPLFPDPLLPQDIFLTAATKNKLNSSSSSTSAEGSPMMMGETKLLPLVTLSPFNFSEFPDDINNNNSNQGNMTLMGSAGDNLQVSFLTLDPLVAEQEDEDLEFKFDTTSTNRSSDSSAGSNSSGSLLPKFQEILQKGVGVVPPQISVEDVDQGIYFSIHDLDNIDDHHHYTGETHSDDSDLVVESKSSFLMDDLGDCGPELGSTIPGDNLDLDLSNSTSTTTTTATTNTPFLEDIEAHSGSSGHDFDMDEGGTLMGSEGLDIENDIDEDDVEEIDIDAEIDAEGDEGGKQELKCKFCGFVCCSKSSLGIHERRHTGERPYACKYCGRLFNSAQCCKHHERLHTGDKPFECQYCGKKYAVSTRLKRHERVHTREEPYKCGEPGCGKTFRWFDAFRDHRNTHNGVPLYLCSVCGKSFTSYLKFYYHERGHFLKRERDRDKLTKAKNNPSSEVAEKKQSIASAPKKPPKPRKSNKTKAQQQHLQLQAQEQEV